MWIEDMDLTSDGKVLAALGVNGTVFFRALRVTADGAADSTFGTSGIFTYSFNDVTASAIKVLPNGRFLLVGEDVGSGKVIRSEANGFIDSTFGTSGEQVIDFGTGANFVRFHSIRVDDSDRIVIGSFVSSGADTGDFATARLNPDGSFDTTFDSDGMVVTDVLPGRDDLTSSVEVQPNGKIVVIGYSETVSGNEISVVRYNDDGSLDTTFDGDGIIQFSGSSSINQWSFHSAIQPFDGKLLMLTGWGTDFRIARLNMGGLEGSDTVEVTDNEPAGPFVVDTLADEDDGDYSAGDFSLREAIRLANTHAGADQIQFAAGLSGGTITLTVDQLVITDDLTITGLGASNLAVSGNNSFRVFDIQNQPDVVIDGLTITGGRTAAAGFSGGGIRATGNFQLLNSVVTNNTTTDLNSSGGGISQINGTLTIVGSTISGNSTTGTDQAGGGIFAISTDVFVTNSIIDGNVTTSAAAAGIFVQNGDFTMIGSTVSNNVAGGTVSATGGVLVLNGNLDIDSSTISGNTSTNFGGGLLFLGTTGTLTNSTVSGNVSTAAPGGGLFVYGGAFDIHHSTITGNSGTSGSGVTGRSDGATVASISVLSSIIADNTGDDVANLLSGSGTNTFTSLGFNLVGSGNAATSFNQGTDQTGVSAGLGPLANNGGPTQTHALLAGSLAINAGDASSTEAFDQRGTGFPRLIGTRVDIGSFEAAQTPSLSITAADASKAEGNSGSTPFTFTVTRSGDTSGAASVDFAITGSGADPAAADDFGGTLPSGTVNFADSETTQIITINVSGDTIVEPDNGFTVTLSNPSAPATITTATADGTILNDDTAPNLPPVLTLPSPPVTFTEGDPPLLIDPLATITDSDSADFDTGTLTVEIISGGTANDLLVIRNEGNGAGQIGVSGSDVTFGGVTIGTFAGGAGTTPMVITFNAASTPAAAQALLRNITFENVSSTPSTVSRVVSAVVTDGDGGASQSSQELLFGYAISMGGSNGDSAQAIGFDASGNSYSVGYFRGTIDVDPGPGVVNLTSSITGRDEVLILSYDAIGALRWAKQLAPNVFNQDTDLTVDSGGNVYVTGLFDGTIDFDPGSGVANLTSSGIEGFILKLDSDGEYVTAGGIGGLRTSITTNAAGDVYLTGFYSGLEDFDPGSGVVNLPDSGTFSQSFVLKLNSSLGFVWARATETTARAASGHGITTDAAGNILTVGVFNGTVDFEPGPGVTSLSTATTDTFDFDVFVWKLDGDGNFVWARGWGGTENDSGEDIVTDSAGNVYTTGYFEVTGGGDVDFDPGPGVSNLTNAGNWDIFVSKLDASGNFVWARQAGTSGNDNGMGIDLDSNENIVVGTLFSGTTDFDPSAGTLHRTASGAWDAAAWGLDSSGNIRFATAYGNSSEVDTPLDLAVDDQDNVLISGQYSGSGDYDPGSGTFNLSSNGGSDLVIMKLLVGLESQTIHVIDLPDTSVGLDGSNDLLIQDINGGDSDDTLMISINGSNIRVHDPNHQLRLIAGQLVLTPTRLKFRSPALPVLGASSSIRWGAMTR